MKRHIKILRWLGFVALLVIATGFTLYMIYLRPVITKIEQTEIIQYDSSLRLVIGGGGNSGVLVSDSLVIVIDTKMGEAAEKLAKMTKQLAGNRHILVVNTHCHKDHVGGNGLYKGQTIIAGGRYNKKLWLNNASEETMPSEWLEKNRDIKMDDETVTIFNLWRNAHTESDVLVYLHKRKMLFCGDVVLNKQVPDLRDPAANPDGYMEALEKLPKKYQIEKVIPGHGAIGGLEILAFFRQYFNDMQKAANESTKKDLLVTKYKDWTQIPIMMAPSNTIKFYQKKITANNR